MGASRSRLYGMLVMISLVLASLACNLGFSSETQPAAKTMQARPLVLVLAPINNSIYAEGTPIQFHAIAQDTLAGVARIEFRLNDIQQIGDRTAQNPAGDPSLEGQITWQAAGKQAHQVIVEAFRADGSSLGESSVRITVTDAPTAAVLTDEPLASPLATSGTNTAANGTATSVPTLTPNPYDLGILPGPGTVTTAAPAQ